MSLKDSAVLYYLFHFLYAGHPASILGKLWITYEMDRYQQKQRKLQESKAQDHAETSRSEAHEVTKSPWEALDESMKESWRAIGVMVNL